MNQVVANIEEISPVKKKLALTISWNEVKAEMDVVYQKVGKKAKIKGFRPGKVPRKILETYYKEQVEAETAENLINKHYWQVLEEKGITPVSRPEIHQDGLKENADFSFAASFETEPEFDPKGYKGMEIEKDLITVTDDDVQRRIDEIRQMFATVHEVEDDRAVVLGDFVVIDFEGSLDGQVHDNLKAKDYFLEIGSRKFVPGFEEQLVGMKKGETKEIKVTFPSDYHENNFAGKDVVFSVSVKSLREKKLPENDETLIKNFEKYESFDDFKADIRKSLEEKAQRMSEISLQNRMTDVLIRENEIDVPSALVDRQIYYMMADTQQRMMSAGIDENSAMEFSLTMKEKYKDDAAKSVKSFLIMKKIAQKESFVVNDEDLDNYFKELAEKSGREYEAIKKMYEDDERKDSVKLEVAQKKVFDFIEKNANIKVVEKTGLSMEAKS